MFENVADGFLGLFLFLSQWISPGTTTGDIRVIAAQQLQNVYRIECSFSINWNEQMNDLIDAGIPLRFLVAYTSDQRDTTAFIRTLRCDVGNYTYFVTDSLLCGSLDLKAPQKKFRQIYRAQRSLTRLVCTFSRNAQQIIIKAELLPSKVSQLNRMVDMSEICDCRTFLLKFSKPK